jgi:hypothetical protein
MLDSETLEALMTCERLKEQLKSVEAESARILGRFEHFDREPTGAERELRRRDFIKIRMELGELNHRLLRLQFIGKRR